ncbi:hypothetical protein BDR03DRAFT_867739 [Suillus americanus]|nr:hypothetical protein BDR03DRAFT_867739 [Suillus americanus]
MGTLHNRVVWDGKQSISYVNAIGDLINWGMDIPDITLVIQWRATCKLSTLWQIWGRATRDWLL